MTLFLSEFYFPVKKLGCKVASNQMDQFADEIENLGRTTMVSRRALKQMNSKANSTTADTSEFSANSPFDDISLYGSHSSESSSENNSGDIDEETLHAIQKSELEEANIERVSQILGEKDRFSYKSGQKKLEDSEPLYFAKFSDKSYKHCRWMTEIDLILTPGGELALRRFRNKSKKVSLTNSLSLPELLTFDENYVDSQWFEVDRILDDRQVNDKTQYFVKWKSQEYEESTWEDESFLNDRTAIEAYKDRKSYSNPKKIPTRWVRPPPELFIPIKVPPKSKTGYVLRDYQLEGLNWLRFCWYNQRNSILADEMGLGKTVQIVTLLNSLCLTQNIRGPYLIVAPLSTLPHWKNEFDRWSDFNTVIYHGSTTSREIIESTEFNVRDETGRIVPSKFGCDVVITTYETISKSFNLFSNIEWRYLVADEGHKLKNYKGKRYKVMQKLHFEHCTLLTGTPIQNDISELWSLLHFLQPEKFNDIDGFMLKYGHMTESSQVQEIQSMIQPLLLRRKKNDVEKSLAPKEETIINVELTKIQKAFYRAFIHENASTLLQQITFGSLPSLQNLMMQLRKVCNHPFLINGAEEGIYNEMKNEESNAKIPEEVLRNKALIESSGKMILLNKLLPKLKKDGHKVLIFSQMVRVLDIIEDFLNIMKYQHERIDGSLTENDRRTSIDRFNSEPEDFVFLLSTKAGGVGINLTSADTVIIYDSDWNPQNDIQAQARCHRIGQTATVKVYRLISRGTYENEMFERASKKLGLDHVVLDGGDMNQNQPMNSEEIEKILRKGAYGIFQDDNTESENFVTADIDQILEHCSKKHVMDASGDGSVFSNATYQIEESADSSNVEFWSKVIPQSMSNKFDNSKFMRKCRKDRIDQENDLDDVENGNRIVHSLIDNGFKYTPVEKKVLRIAFTIKHPDDIESIAVLHRIVHCNLDNDDEDDEEIKYTKIDDIVTQFGEIALTVIEKADKIVERVAYFARLERALHFVQGTKFKWPEIQPIWEDPYAEYSLMVGLLKYGWKNINHIYSDKNLLLKHVKQLNQSQIEERIYELIVMIETQLDDNYSLPRNFEPMNPAKWREQHAYLQDRFVLYYHELLKLFNFIKYYGIIEKSNGSVNVKKMKEKVELDSVSNELLLRTIEQLNAFSSTIKSESDAVNFDDYPELEPLQNRVKAKDFLSYARTVEVMRAVNKFVENYCEYSDILIAKTPKNSHLPTWWTPQHDAKLAFAIHNYGTAFVSSWIIDPQYPFINHIDDDLLPDFKKAASKEKKRNKLVKPPKLGDFSFLYRKRSRLSRVVLACEYVNKRLEKSLRNNFDPSKYEMVLSSKLRIISFGEYKGHHTKFGICPVGFISERQYGENEKNWYICEIQEDQNKRLQFLVRKKKQVHFHHNDESSSENETNDTVTSDTSAATTQNNNNDVNNNSVNDNSVVNNNHEDEEDELFVVSNSPIMSWKMILEKEDKIPGSRVTGVSLFGLSNKKVKDKLLEMEKSYKEKLKIEEAKMIQQSRSPDTEVAQQLKQNDTSGSYNLVKFTIPVRMYERGEIRETIINE
ncbi:SNF2 family N-terminal domain containing protein [Tritrichomonas foetus]|uniref:SNF2 family N-terminal domain containing protein n=1 Tax=Tritrichomonas foetus TaxID=1144522 RepID=A0A1J4KZ37_9EUKA|nr:SNF2 family N-terminal domain containing protein [Tritrichomonas foetus]|eukprot:OHT14974.1 SNF2 family N-terminal domain containing protein [Tritrichomonas foetus]